MTGGMLAAFVIVAVLIARGYAASRPPGYRITFADRVLVALVVFAVGFSAMGVASLGFNYAPEVTLLQRAARGLTLVVVGIVPLSLFWLGRVLTRGTSDSRVE